MSFPDPVALPDPDDPSTFDTRAYPFTVWQKNFATALIAALPSIAAKLWATVGSSSTANALVLSCGFPALATGMQIRFRATATNTGGATLNLDGLGAKACRTVTGVALPAGYIRTDADTTATYDGTYWVLDRVIERGSNANGQYVRYADGTQECWNLSFMDETVSESTGGTSTWTYPAAFNGFVVTTASNWGVNTTDAFIEAAQYVGLSIQTGTSTSAIIGYFNRKASSLTVRIGVRAVGRWY